MDEKNEREKTVKLEVFHGSVLFTLVSNVEIIAFFKQLQILAE